MTIARLAVAGLVFGCGAAWAQAPAPAAKPTIPQICTNCHKAEAGNLRGVFENVAFKSQAIQLKIDATTEIVKFDPKTIQVVEAGDAKPAEALRDIRKEHEAKIEYVEKDGAKTATKIWFKGPIKIAPEKLVTYDEVAALVAKGPRGRQLPAGRLAPAAAREGRHDPHRRSTCPSPPGFDELVETPARRQVDV